MLNAYIKKFPSKLHIVINILLLLMLSMTLSVKSYMGVIIFFLFLISLNFRWNNQQYRLEKFEKVWMFLLVLYFISAVLSFYAVQFEDFTMRNLDIPLRFVLVLPIFILFKKTLLSEGVFWVGSLMGSFSAGSLALYQHFTQNIVNAKGMANHHIVFGNISICLATISFIGLIRYANKPIYIKALFFTGILSGLAASLFSGARGGWIALPFLVFYFLWIFRSQLGIRKILLFFVVLISISILLYQVDQTGVSKRFNAAVSDIQEFYLQDNYQSSVGRRLEMFKGAWIIFKENPWLGTGPDSFVKESNKLEKEGRMRPIKDILAHPHNEYLNAMYSRGSLGFIILMLIYLLPIIYFSREYHKTRSLMAFLGVLLPLSYMIFSMSEAMLDRMLSLMFFLMIMFYISTLYHQSNEPKNRKKILIDLTRSKHLFNGQGQFCFILGNELSKLKSEKIEKYYLIRKTERTLFPGQDKFEWLHFYHRVTLPRWIRFFFQLLLPVYDVWHVTAQDSNFWPVPSRTKVILTIHDLNFLIESKTETRKKRRLKRLQRRVDRANYITTISQFSASEIRANLVTGDKPIQVIYNGGIVQNSTQNSYAKKPAIEALETKFLFFIGVVKPKKNIHVLIPFMNQLDGYQLVIAGDDSDEYATWIKNKIINLGIQDKVFFTGKVSDEERYWLYMNCSAFLFPSLAEGFGLPVIEAMSYKKPVFLSKKTSLPEVAGEIGFYFKCFSSESMVDTFEQGMSVFEKDLSYPDKLKARADEFNWVRAAKEYNDLYERL